MKTFIEFITEKENQDDLPFEMSKDDVINWVKRIHEDLISDGKKKWQGRHYGDCTKQNVSCQLCMYQDWLEEYYEYCKQTVNDDRE